MLDDLGAILSYKEVAKLTIVSLAKQNFGA